MKTDFSLVLLLASLFPVAVPAGEPNAPTLIIHSSGDRGLRSTNFSPKLIAALWDDGRIVWSESRIEGGPPYRQGRFPRGRLDSLLQSLETQGAFTNAALGRAWFGPDADFTTIALTDGRRRLRMQSWHELFEQRTNLVATAHGIETLGARERAAVLRGQPADYRRFRETWSEVREALAALIPKTGELFEGQVQIPEE